MTMPTQDLNFCVVSDLHGPLPGFPELVRRLADERPEFVIIAGDLLNANDDDTGPWERFEAGMAPFREAGLTYWAIPGNHDLEGNSPAARRLWAHRSGMPNGGFFYSFDKGPTHFTGLAVTHGLLREQFDLPGGRISQADWLVQDLADTRDATWRFIFQHEPGDKYCRLTEGVDGPGRPDVSELVEPQSFEAGVDLVFRGHQHLYERTYPIDTKAGKRDDARGVTHVTLGGGNPGFRPLDANDAAPLWFDAVISADQMHYMTIHISGSSLHAEAKNLDGDVFDSFTIEKDSDGKRRWDGLPSSSIFLVANEPRAF